MPLEERIKTLGSLFQQRYGLITGTARYFTPSEDLIDDIVQQVYIDFVHGGADKNWDLSRDVTPLLFKITKEKALMATRERVRRKQRSLDEIVDFLDDPALYLWDDEMMEFDDFFDEISALEHCLEQLPPNTRHLIERHYYQGEAIKSIALAESRDVASLYRLFRKIRLTLKVCIERSLGNQSANHEQ